MPNYYLVKSEPYVYSFADLQRDGRAMWDGVRNFEARNNLRAMKQGDLLLFYHSNEGKAVVGVATVTGPAYADPTADPKKGGDGGDWSVVDVAPVCALNKPVSLDDIRSQPRLAQINLLRRNRLSVVPVTAAEFRCILQMGETTLPSPFAPASSRSRTTAKKTPAVGKDAKQATTRSAKTTRRAPRASRGSASLLLGICLLAWLSGIGAPVCAQPPEATGKVDAAALLDAKLSDLQDRSASLRGYLDRSGADAPVVVVLHHDRKSAEQNAQFKAELGRLSAQRLPQLRVVALADVDGYNFWPAKGFVKAALRPLQGQGATVLVDWKGDVRKQYGLKSGQSAVFVLAPSGELQTLVRGTLSDDEAKSLLQTIRALLPSASELATP